jgi:hypothetical protein
VRKAIISRRSPVVRYRKPRTVTHRLTTAS